MSRLKDLYSSRVASGRVRPDPAQAEAVARLDALGRALSASRRWFGGAPRPKGLYIWGPVGRGKSMLMDLFFESLTTDAKTRVHFHDFMLGIHAFIFKWRNLSAAERRRHPAYVREAGEDPIAPAAQNIVNSASVLCFDEFHVTQLADAMILGRLFEHLFARGVTIVATSNRKPSDLYLNGVNRQLFVPFIRRMEEELDVIELRAERDYRLERLSAAPVYYTPLGAASDAAMDAAYERLTGRSSPHAETLDVNGRPLRVSIQAAGVARFSFDELCRKPLGSADYLAIARRYDTVLIDRTPRMNADEREAAARFVTLIDALYECRTKLVMSAAAKPDELYLSGDGVFEFQRTASRLHEMRSTDYLGAERVQANS